MSDLAVRETIARALTEASDSPAGIWVGGVTTPWVDLADAVLAALASATEEGSGQ